MKMRLGAAVLMLGSCAVAQPAGGPPAGAAGPGGQPAGEKPGRAPALPPSLQLGLRVDGVRRKLPVAPVVVVVPDVSSYVEAIGRWRLTARFPVLIDDGTPPAREAIARFVRAFEPKAVVRWSSGKKTMGEWGADTALIEEAVGRAWTVDGKGPEKGFDLGATIQLWKSLQLAPPGVVVAAKDDPAWPAAVALAAGRGQPIFWTTSTRRLDNAMTQAEADQLCRDIEGFCDRTTLPWKASGDVLEAVTLCTAMPQTYKGPGGVLATTDRVGRVLGGAARWAWSGQVFGYGWAPAWRAMCSLFLAHQRRAWVFDSYPDAPGWNTFDGRKASDVLQKLGWSADVIGKPDGTIDAWKKAARTPLSAEVLLVNTKGEKDAFHLASGSGRPADLPILARPAVVHFVHSFSAQYVGTRDTLAGRWIDRGAYAYAGSVDEPRLEGFVPTPAVAGLLAAQVPFGAAVRLDGAPVWKIAVLGDPLTTFGPAGPAAPAEAATKALDGSVDLAETLKKTLAADLAAGAWDLVMLGRDEEAARLGAALAGAPAAEFKPEAALATAMALFRTGKTAEFLALTARIPAADLAKHPEIADARGLAGGR